MVGAFEFYDDQKTGFIDEKTLKHVMCNIGPKLSAEEYKDLLKMADPKGSGKIDYKEFLEELLG
jgi:calmodulin